MADGGRGGDVELRAAAVEGMQGAFPGSMEGSGGRGDAFGGMEDDAQVAVGV